MTVNVNGAEQAHPHVRAAGHRRRERRRSTGAWSASAPTARAAPGTTSPSRSLPPEITLDQQRGLQRRRRQPVHRRPARRLDGGGAALRLDRARRRRRPTTRSTSASVAASARLRTSSSPAQRAHDRHRRHRLRPVRRQRLQVRRARRARPARSSSATTRRARASRSTTRSPARWSAATTYTLQLTLRGRLAERDPRRQRSCRASASTPRWSTAAFGTLSRGGTSSFDAFRVRTNDRAFAAAARGARRAPRRTWPRRCRARRDHVRRQPSAEGIARWRAELGRSGPPSLDDVRFAVADLADGRRLAPAADRDDLRRRPTPHGSRLAARRPRCTS